MTGTLWLVAAFLATALLLAGWPMARAAWTTLRLRRQRATCGRHRAADAHARSLHASQVLAWLNAGGRP